MFRGGRATQAAAAVTVALALALAVPAGARTSAPAAPTKAPPKAAKARARTTATTRAPATPPVPTNVDVVDEPPVAPTTVAPRTTMPPTTYVRPSSPFQALPYGGSCRSPVATVARWPLRRRVAQLIVAGAETRNLASARGWVTEHGIGGILLRGFPSGAQSVTDGIAALKEAADIPPLVGVDEEGGRVQVLRPVTGTFPSARRLARQYTTEEVRVLVAEHGAKVRELGVDMVFGPVLDVTAERTGVISDRAFSDDPAVVAEYGQAYAEGLRDAGLLPVLKHFPGHGLTAGDSHSARVATRPYRELVRTDIPPFRAVLAGGGPVAVMVGHLEVPGLTGPTPASVSRDAVTGLLREKIGFRGLVLTDSLAMAAVNLRWSPPNAAIAAVAAGADMAVFVTVDDLEQVIDFLERAVVQETIDEAQLNRSVVRVLRAKGVNPCDVQLRTP